MRRRVNTLASSTQASKKKRSWREDAEGPGSAPPPPPEDSDDELLRSRVLDSDEEPTAGGAAPRPGVAPAGPNPVVWMDFSVAGRAVGRVHFELFRDLYPTATGNFLKLCVGIAVDGKQLGYQGTEVDTIIPGRMLEGGDLVGSVDLPAIERDCSRLGHAKAGLLTVSPGNPSYGSSRFQLTFGARPELDGQQVVFGQLVTAGAASGKLHALHWVESVGATGSGAPREAVVVDACGESGATEAEALLGAMVMAAQVDRAPESQEDRFARAGQAHGKLVDSIDDENVSDVLELTEDLLEHLQWAAKKVKTASEKDRKAKEMEASLKDLIGVLEHVQFKAGEVVGFDNKLASKAKMQLNGAKELETLLVRLY